MEGSIVSFEFLREDVEALRLGPYLKKLESFSENPKDAFDFMHRVIFHVQGFDLDPRGLSVIEPVKIFFKELHKQWPYFIHFAYPDQDNIAWWFAVNYFPVVGREDGGVNYLSVDTQTYSKAMTEIFTHSNTLADRHKFDVQAYLNRQMEMTQTINFWLFGRDF